MTAVIVVGSLTLWFDLQTKHHKYRSTDPELANEVGRRDLMTLTSFRAGRLHNSTDAVLASQEQGIITLEICQSSSVRSAIVNGSIIS
jgi:hypothetical protein